MAGDGYYGGNMYISITIPIPNWKSRDSPYPYPVNAGIPRQNGDGFGQYPSGWIYLLFLPLGNVWKNGFEEEWVNEFKGMKIILCFIWIKEFDGWMNEFQEKNIKVIEWCDNVIDKKMF